MVNVIDHIPAEYRELFVDVLTERDPELLATLRCQDRPTVDQRSRVNGAFANMIVEEMNEDYVPSERGKRAERTIEEFWQLWPRNVP